jgi:two-component system, chemotaxis family, protein-glutamate methylesterase/glutaminase
VEAEQVPLVDRALPERVVGIAASAGGVEAIRQVVATLPRDFPGAVCITLHIPATGRSLLAPILDRESRLPAVLATDGMALRAGVIYVAPADHHLLVGRDALRLSRGPKENGTRPAADPMFRSLAEAWGPCAVAVVLSGALDDGSAGAVAIAGRGGVVIVQDPRDALVSSMPASTIAADSPERVVRAAEMGGVLSRLFGERVPDSEGGSTMSEPVQPPRHPSRPAGPASAFTCPECSGALWELREGELLRYRCRVGHSYSEDAMVDAQAASVEAALWAALEVLEERGELLQRIAERMHGRTPNTERRFREDARDALGRAALIRRALMLGSGDGGLAREHHIREAAGG